MTSTETLGSQHGSGAPATLCPDWCAIRHGNHDGEDDHVHIGGALLVRHTVLRLCASTDIDTGNRDGPYVLVGAEEYTLYEAEALIDALTQLVDQGNAQPPSPAVSTAVYEQRSHSATA